LAPLLLMWICWPSPPLHGPPPTLPRRSALQMRCKKTAAAAAVAAAAAAEAAAVAAAEASAAALWLSPSAWDQLAILLHQLSPV
jgi:hypothetical protein